MTDKADRTDARCNCDPKHRVRYFSEAKRVGEGYRIQVDCRLCGKMWWEHYVFFNATEIEDENDPQVFP